MKKIIWTGIILCCCMLAGYAQQVKNFEDICRKYKGEENVVNMHMGKMGCLFVSLFVKDDDGAAGRFIRKSDSFRLLVVEGENNEELKKEVKAYLRDGKLEELMSVKEKKEEVRIYVLDHEKTIRQLFLAISDGEDQVYLQVEGRFPMKLIQELAREKH